MKFLVINRADGMSDHGIANSANEATLFSSRIKELLSDGTIENAYAFISGGHAYVINAADTEELAVKVRANPLFDSSTTEIIPIADAVDFLDGYAAKYAKA